MGSSPLRNVPVLMDSWPMPTGTLFLAQWWTLCFIFSLNNHIFIQIYIYAALNILKLLFLASVLHSGLVFMEAEPLAETEPLEEVDGAALCASGLFLPVSLDETIDVFFLLCLSCSHSLL